jgi:hypothetical protein
MSLTADVPVPGSVKIYSTDVLTGPLVTTANGRTLGLSAPVPSSSVTPGIGAPFTKKASEHGPVANPAGQTLLAWVGVIIEPNAAVQVIVTLRYPGNLPPLPDTNPKKEIEEQSFVSGLSGYLSGLHADRIERSAKGEDCEIKLVFQL